MAGTNIRQVQAEIQIQISMSYPNQLGCHSLGHSSFFGILNL